jgi:hypothetical protein
VSVPHYDRRDHRDRVKARFYWLLGEEAAQAPASAQEKQPADDYPEEEINPAGIPF